MLDAKASWIEAALDYRRTGSRPGMPDSIPIERCEQVRGINTYTPRELVTRKLQTVIGERARLKARDIYDAAWIVSERPELVGAADARKLGEWMDRSDGAQQREMERRLQGDRVTRQVSSSRVYEALRAGIRRLRETPRDQST